jgi:hypothetical protein
LALETLPIYLLDVPTLRLDRPHDLLRLRAAIDAQQPRLLVLDPFVRLARIDENSAADVSSVLASLRAIQRDYHLAVLLVHHARKSPASHPNQALRGSSDFAAWSDSSLYLTRTRERLSLLVEHRNAPAPEPMHLRLSPDPAPHLTPLDSPLPEPDLTDSLQSELLRLLADSPRPVSTVELRERLRKRKADVVLALEALRRRGLLDRDPRGWCLSSNESTVPLFPP